MSLATRCPACGTTFRVVRDQLRISDGWVRCGRCSHVFDGAAALHDPQAMPVVPAPATPAEAPSSPAFDAPVLALPMAGPAPGAGIDFFSDALQRLQADGPPPAASDAAPTAAGPATDVPPEDEMPEEPAPAATDAVFDIRPGQDSWSSLPSLQLGSGGPAPTTPPPEAAAVLPEPEPPSAPSALRQARIASLQAARLARARAKDDEVAAVVLTASDPAPMSAADEPPGGRPSAFGIARQFRASPGATAPSPRRAWPGVLLVAALALLLLAQLLYQQRDAIVARQPALQPWAAALCERLGCRVSALRRIADISIDGASFSRERNGEGYQFSFTLRNRAAVPLAMPAVELSLLDLEERIVVRRVLRPAEYGAPAVLAAHAERATLLPIALAGEDAASTSRVAGFRLDTFYP